MKECWINVYKSLHSTWYGNPWPTEYDAEIRRNNYLIYRIHVRIK